MDTSIKNRLLADANSLTDTLMDQSSSTFRVFTTGGAYFDITLMSGGYTLSMRFGTEFLTRQTCQVRHGIYPLARDGVAPTMSFDPHTLTIIFGWEGNLPSSISPLTLSEMHWLDRS